MSFQGRYDEYGWDYARINPLDERAVRWYRRHARETDGPVLELACGTGRLLVALARDGHEVTGLDLSSRMLEHARRNAEDLSPAARARIRLVEGDMQRFALPDRFGLVVIADNSLRELESKEAIVACLRCARRHLSAGGRVLVTERRFDEARFGGGARTWPWTEPVPHPSTGAPVRRQVHVEVDREAGLLRGTMTYRVETANGGARDRIYAWTNLILMPDDYLPLFEAAGLRAELFVGYEDRPDDGVDPMLVFCATAAAGP